MYAITFTTLEKVFLFCDIKPSDHKDTPIWIVLGETGSPRLFKTKQEAETIVANLKETSKFTRITQYVKLALPPTNNTTQHHNQQKR